MAIETSCAITLLLNFKPWLNKVSCLSFPLIDNKWLRLALIVSVLNLVAQISGMMSYHSNMHTEGEILITDSKTRQDNMNQQCTIGYISNIFDENAGDHSGISYPFFSSPWFLIVSEGPYNRVYTTCL